MCDLEQRVEEARAKMEKRCEDLLASGMDGREVCNDIEYILLCEDWKELLYEWKGKPEDIIPDIRYREWLEKTRKRVEKKKSKQNDSNSIKKAYKSATWVYDVYDQNSKRILKNKLAKDVAQTINRSQVTIALAFSSANCHSTLINGYKVIRKPYKNLANRKFKIYDVDDNLIYDNINLEDVMKLTGYKKATINSSSRFVLKECPIKLGKYKILKNKGIE